MFQNAATDFEIVCEKCGEDSFSSGYGEMDGPWVHINV